jgi:hypothetical protein
MYPSSEAPHPDYTAIVSGPFWTIPMRETELQEFVELLGQLRRVVQQLDGAGQWLPGSADRPASRIKVGGLLLTAHSSAHMHWAGTCTDPHCSATPCSAAALSWRISAASALSA